MTGHALHSTRVVLSLARSHIFDLPARPPSRARVVVASQPSSNVYLRALSSPLRRCILTQKVLPRDLMIQLKLARPPPTAATNPNRLILTPSSLLHPRFTAPMPGKGTWVLCSSTAIEALAAKGSYKRVSAAATLSATTTKRKIHSQLARRVAQEGEMFALRVGSRPSFISGAPTVENEGKELRQCPVRKLARGEEAELSAEREGMKLVAILDLSTSTSAEGHGLLTFPLPAFPTVPRYHLAPFLSAALVPPASPSSTPPDQQQDDPLTALRQSLDGLRTLFARRRMDQVQGEEQEENLEGAVYALYAPTGAGEGSVEGKGEVGAVEDVVPLLLALWRCALWCGEGWGEV